MLNLLWLSFILIAFASACLRSLFLGDMALWNDMAAAIFTASKLSFELALGLVGIMCFWLGIMEIGKDAGLIRKLAHFLTPLFSRLMPDVPKNHPAMGSITLNIAANVLGLDNAATPAGLKAMQDLQTLNKSSTTASDAQIFFLVLNSASVTLLPVTIFMYRAQAGAVNPTDVFIPILLATTVSTLVGLGAVAWVQKLKIWDKVVLAYLAGFVALLTTLCMLIFSAPTEKQTLYSAASGNFILLSVIAGFLAYGAYKKVPVYESFITGAKQGFSTALTIVPYLVAMLVAVSLLRASGAMDIVLHGIEYFVRLSGMNTAFVDALPTAIMKPFSGSGARAMMVETMQHHGADSFAGRLSAIFQGSSETTFYVLAVYMGAVGLTRARHAIACALLADAASILAAILIAYLFFGA